MANAEQIRAVSVGSISQAGSRATWSATWLTLQRFTAPLQGPLLLALTYFLGAEAAFYVGTLSDRIFALFWPPNVILFCALLIVPSQHWWRYIVAAFVAHVVAETTVGMSFVELLAAFASNCMVALLNAFGVRRFIGGAPWFGDLRKAFTYIGITAGFSPAIAALGGAFVPILGGGALSDYWSFWSHWYVANALPNLTLGPVFLIWIGNGSLFTGWRPSFRHIKPAILTVALVVTCIVTSEVGAQVATGSFFPLILVAPLPLVLWATVQYGARGASGTILVVTVILTSRILHGDELFPGEEPSRTVLALQLFLTGLSIPVLLFGALIDGLRNAEQTTRDLAASLLRAQDEERRRIARDLHDSTGQNLIAATLIAGRMESELTPSGLTMLRQIETMLQQSIHEIRTVSYLLHPPLLDEGGLVLALRCYVEGYVERSGIALDLEIVPDLPRLSSDVELVLFRLVQEALTNISRHSGSATARIRLGRRITAEGFDVVLTIEDSGKGMPGAVGGRPLMGPKADPRLARGVGLASMRERLAQIGGRLHIDSVVGRTTVTATIPVRDGDA